MATRAVTIDYPAPGVMRATWAALTTNGDVGASLNAVGWADKTMQLTGTYGTGGDVDIEGSNDGTNWAVLTATDSTTALEAITSGSPIYGILENPLHIRPKLTAGTGTISLVLVIIGKKTK